MLKSGGCLSTPRQRKSVWAVAGISCLCESPGTVEPTNTRYVDQKPDKSGRSPTTDTSTTSATRINQTTRYILTAHSINHHHPSTSDSTTHNKLH